LLSLGLGLGLKTKIFGLGPEGQVLGLGFGLAAHGFGLVPCGVTGLVNIPVKILKLPLTAAMCFILVRLSMATFHKVLGQDEQCAKKFRRRQSDARWRANLASCYETLKLVIPLTTRASKKQISKVVQLFVHVPSHHFYRPTVSLFIEKFPFIYSKSLCQFTFETFCPMLRCI